MDYKIALANLANGALLGYKDNTKVMEYKKIVEDEIDRLRQWDVNKDSRNSRQRVELARLLKKYENLKQIEEEHQKENGRLREENKRLYELCMYALISSTKIYNHELAIDTKKNFQQIIRENLNKDTYTIREKIKKSWDGK